MTMSATGNANSEFAGNGATGTISMMFMTQMKKNSDTRNGRKPSPLFPIIGRKISSRTNRTPSSPSFWAPLGTSFGRQNAAQKNATTLAAQMTHSSIGLFKVNEPTLNKGPYVPLHGYPRHA